MAINPLPTQRGFILAAVLWTIAIMLIAVGIFHSYVQRKLAVANQSKAHIEQRLDAISTEQTVLYLLATSRMTLAGMTFNQLAKAQVLDENVSSIAAVGDELWFDSTVYQGVGSANFSLQDMSGLVSLNVRDYTFLSALIDSYEHDSGIKSRLLAALSDYIDEDDIISLGGAEKHDYLAKGMAEPANDFLRTVPELKKVMGWQNWLSLHPEIQLQNWFSLRRFSIMNLNAVPKSLLVPLFGVDGDMAEKVVKIRRTNPLRSIDEFGLLIGKGIPVDEEYFRYFPSNELSLRIWNKRGGQAQLISLQLTPNGLLGPWQVDYEYSVQSVDNNNEALAIRQSALFNHPLGDDR